MRIAIMLTKLNAVCNAKVACLHMARRELRAMKYGCEAAPLIFKRQVFGAPKYL